MARRLVGLVLSEGAPPSRGDTILAAEKADKKVGEVTSAASSPLMGAPIALGYVHRDFVEPGTAVTVDGRVGAVAELPFVSVENATDRVAAE